MLKVTTTTTHQGSIELRHPYDEHTWGPVTNEDARALLLAGLRAVNPGKIIPDDIEITLRNRSIDFKWEM